MENKLLVLWTGRQMKNDDIEKHYSKKINEMLFNENVFFVRCNLNEK